MRKWPRLFILAALGACSDTRPVLAKQKELNALLVAIKDAKAIASKFDGKTVSPPGQVPKVDARAPYKEEADRSLGTSDSNTLVMLEADIDNFDVPVNCKFVGKELPSRCKPTRLPGNACAVEAMSVTKFGTFLDPEAKTATSPRARGRWSTFGVASRSRG